MKLSWSLTSVALVCLIFVAGCGGGGSTRKLVKATGTVKLDGKPLPQGTITFVADGGGANNAAGEINSSGYYSLSTQGTGDGVPPGNYKVRIESWSSPPKMDATGVVPGTSAVPARYTVVETSELTATVKESPSAQTFDFSLVP